MSCVISEMEFAQAAALDLAARGVPCFPCSTMKAPTTQHGFKDASRDQKDVRALWEKHPGPLVGVPTGESSGLNVLDIDPRSNGDAWYTTNRNRLPRTRIHQTRSGGLHLFFRHDVSIKCSVGRIARGVDVRAEGGYVIWWPAAGLPVLEGSPPARWPEWVRPTPRLAARPPHRVVIPDNAALRRLIRIVAAGQPGERNNLTFWAACRVGEMVSSGMLPASTAASVIAEAAIRAGLSPAEAERTVWSGIRTAGGYGSA